MWSPKRAYVVTAAGVALAGCLAALYMCRDRGGDVSLGPFGKAVQRAPIAITAEEIQKAKSGGQAHGRVLRLEIPAYYDWYLSRRDPVVQVHVQNTRGPGLGLPGKWIPEIRGADGLPPEMCFLEATRDGAPLPCDKRPPGPEGYGGLGNKGMSYPIHLNDWGDFSKPGKYTLRMIVKCPLWAGQKESVTVLLASNEIEFVVP
ncbi:MAG: hypothetical protein FJ291_02700 [Planctomycetes bacterium]|nr:hypothetical protein [Planctomycetota bacterium]